MTEFLNKCRSRVYGVLTAWADDIDARSVDSRFYPGDYRITAKHSFGTAYCDWTDKKQDLVDALKACGATYIKAKVRYNYVELYFKQRKVK